MGQTQTINDGLVNVVANLGTARDKAAHTGYVSRILSPSDLFSAYENSWLAAAIVDYPAEDATRKWRQWRAKADQITKIEQLEAKLGLKEKTQEAMIAARLYGGAAIFINTADEDQSAPLKAGTEVISLVVLSSNTLRQEEKVDDVNSPYYGMAEYYVINTKTKGSYRIHASRLAVFYGSKLPADSAQFAGNFQSWGASVLQSTMDAIHNNDSTMANVASLVFEAKVDVFKFAGFAEMLANSANDEAVYRRLMAQAAMKGINGSVVIDAEDDYQQKSASFASLADVIKEFKEAAAGAARIPMTRLFGRSSAGLSGSGDGDERVYFDRIGSAQSSDIGPALALLDECIIEQALGSRPPEVYYEWRPLRQLAETERADIFNKTATAIRTLAGAQTGEVIPLDALSDAAVNELVEQGMLPGLEQGIAKYGSLAEQGMKNDMVE